MADRSKIPFITEIPAEEELEFNKLIKSHRKKYIRTSQEIVEKVFLGSPDFQKEIKNNKISSSIKKLRELVWNEYLGLEIK